MTCRPDFIILGERRCGTSSLTSKLSQHSEIFLHPNKDRGYFIDDEARRGSAWVDKHQLNSSWEETHSQEDYSSFFREAKPNLICGEKSADYLFHPESLDRIISWFPDIKLLVTLRHPIKRAYSHYWNEIGKGREALSFKKAITNEPKRLLNSYERNHLSYIERGFYDKSLSYLFDIIPRKQILITTLEQMIEHPKSEMSRISHFLGVDTNFKFTEHQSQANANSMPVPRRWTMGKKTGFVRQKYATAVDLIANQLARNDKKMRRTISRKLKSPFYEPFRYQAMEDATWETLRETYRPHMAKLDELLGGTVKLWPDLQD